jgi:hypothetical protein
MGVFFPRHPTGSVIRASGAGTGAGAGNGGATTTTTTTTARHRRNNPAGGRGPSAPTAVRVIVAGPPGPGKQVLLSRLAVGLKGDKGGLSRPHRVFVDGAEKVDGYGGLNGGATSPSDTPSQPPPLLPAPPLSPPLYPLPSPVGPLPTPLVTFYLVAVDSLSSSPDWISTTTEKEKEKDPGLVDYCLVMMYDVANRYIHTYILQICPQNGALVDINYVSYVPSERNSASLSPCLATLCICSTNLKLLTLCRACILAFSFTPLRSSITFAGRASRS